VRWLFFPAEKDAVGFYRTEEGQHCDQVIVVRGVAVDNGCRFLPITFLFPMFSFIVLLSFVHGSTI